MAASLRQAAGRVGAGLCAQMAVPGRGGGCSRDCTLRGLCHGIHAKALPAKAGSGYGVLGRASGRAPEPLARIALQEA